MHSSSSLPGTSPSPAPQDEINLFDLWDILVRFRWRLLTVWGLTIAAALSYLALATPVYESRAVVQIGQIGGKPLHSPTALALELRERYELDEKDRSRPLLRRVNTEESALILEAEAESAEQAQAFLLQIVEELLPLQQQNYAQARSLKQNALESLELQIQRLEEQIQQLTTNTQSEVDEAVKALALLQGSTLQADLPVLYKQRLQLQQELAEPNSQPSRVVREPTLPRQASSPRTALTLALAVMLGGMLGSMAAFLSEFARQARQRPPAPA